MKISSRKITRFSRKDSKKDPSFTPQSHGLVPLWRALAVAAVGVLIAFSTIWLSWKGWIFDIPHSYRSEFLAPWTITSLVVPHIICFVYSLIGGLWILTLKDFKYVLWIVKQSASALFTIFLGVEAVMILFVSMVISSATSLDFSTSQFSPMTRIEGTLWFVSLYSLGVPLWLGYRSGWRAFRENGAMTMQERADRDNADLEIHNSGQLWEKMELFVKKFFGMRGDKPHGGFIWLFIVSPFMTVIMLSVGYSFFTAYQYGALVMGGLMCTIVWFAAVAKSRDGAKIDRYPRLSPVRDQNTQDSYNPGMSSVSSPKIGE